MKIGELAQKTLCTVETIRYYEKEGLLPAPSRTTANYRSYNNTHVERLRFIRNCRALDMSHEEVRGLLNLMEQPAGDCTGVNHLLAEHIAHVDVRIAELSHLRLQLDALRQLCQKTQTVDSCGILQGLTTMESDTKRKRHSHLG
jgi:Cd(II)/Pb(II)-responsive transcriptional regulator